MNNQAYEEGRKAFEMDKPLIDNPYSKETDEARAWHNGWKDRWWKGFFLQTLDYNARYRIAVKG